MKAVVAFTPLAGALVLPVVVPLLMVRVGVGAGVLAAVSGPTAMAVRLAQTAGITLAGFVRSGTMVVYNHPQRLHIG